MLGLAVTLFFSLTGITLNHPDWFPSSELVRTATGNLPLEILVKPVSQLESAAESRVDELEIVEQLRAGHDIHARLKDIVIDDYQIMVAFAGPGYSADVFIERETGKYEFNELRMGFVPWINDLHKGRDTGLLWSILIDVSALILTVISATGLSLVFWLRLTRRSSLMIAGVGTVAAAVAVVIAT